MSDGDLERRMERIESLVAGNGQPGLIKRVGDMEGHLYKDDDTGEAGLVADVRQIKATITSAAAWIKGGVAVGAATGLLEVLRRYLTG